MKPEDVKPGMKVTVIAGRLQGHHPTEPRNARIGDVLELSGVGTCGGVVYAAYKCPGHSCGLLEFAKDHQAIGLHLIDPIERKCTCPMRTLLITGCTCGGV